MGVLYNLSKYTAEAIDNFDLNAINETLNHLLYYDLPEAQISALNKVKFFINIFDYGNTYEAISTYKYSLTIFKQKIPKAQFELGIFFISKDHIS